MQHTAKEAFDALVQAIKTAVAERGFYVACEHAEALGLIGGKIALRYSEHYLYEGVDAAGDKIRFDAYSYNPSGPTQIYPPATRFAVSVSGATAPLWQYDNEYEGLIKPRSKLEALTDKLVPYQAKLEPIA